MRPTVLVVASDKVAVARLLRAIDEVVRSCEVASATSLSEAKRWLADRRVAVLVTEATLPEGRGAELAIAESCDTAVLLTDTVADELAARTTATSDLDCLSQAADAGHLALLPYRVAQALRRAETTSELRRRRASETRGDLLQALADHVPVVLGYWGKDQRCRCANRTYEQWFNVPPGGMVGRSLEELLGPVYPLNRPHIEAALRGEPQHFERMIQTQPGQAPRYASASYAPYVRDGQVEGFFVVVTDISEIKQLTSRLSESERRWETLFSILPVGVSILSSEGRVTAANPELGRILGMHPEAILRGEHRQLAFLTPDGSPIPGSELTRSLLRQDELGAAADVGVVRSDGSSLWISSIAARLPDEPGSYVIASSDITLRRRAERALAENEARLRALLDAAVDGIVTIDAQHNIRTANLAVSRMFGYSLGELIGAPVGLLMPDDTRNVHHQLIARYEATREPKVIGTGREVVGRHRDGSDMPLFLSVAELPPEANVGKYLAMLHDLRTRKAMEAEKRVLEDHLRESEKLHAVGRLAGGVAHDFNNILTVVELCGSRILQEVERGSLIQREIEQILGAGRRGADLVRQLLTFSRPDLVSRSTVDLSAVVRRLEPMLRRLLPANIQLAIDTTESEPVEADLAHMDQVIMNLVLNARDAMRDGGSLIVSVRSLTLSPAEAQAHPPLRAGSCVELLVRDSGIGMSKGVSERAFEPFFTTKGLGLGTGLGLATVYAIVQEAGGCIDLTTAPQHGTTVRVWLPRAAAALNAAAPAPQEPTIPVRNSTVLLVEDQPEILDLVTQLFTDQGYRVLPALTGERAVELAQRAQEPIDLLFSDVIMPGMSGPQVFQRVAVLHPGIKVLFASGYSDEVVEIDADKPAAFEFLAKPYSVTDLLSIVARLLDNKRS